MSSAPSYRLSAQQPEWKELLPGVSFEFLPASRQLILGARRAVRKWLEDNPDQDSDQTGEIFSEALLQAAITGWKGLGDDQGEMLVYSPDLIPAVLADATLFDAAEREYVIPVILRDREKKISAPSSNGTGTKATAAKTTVSSAVKPKRTGAAKNARTGKTSPKR